MKIQHTKIFGMKEQQCLKGNFQLKCIYGKEEGSNINNLHFLLRRLKKEEQFKPRANRKKEILETKSRKVKTGKQQRKSTKPKAGSLKR